MAKYTTTLKTYMTSRLMIDNPKEDVESWGYAKIIEQGMKYVFDFDYPIFDESYRNILQTKILKNYYMREIAHETIGLFKMRLDNQLNVSMPYFNQLYDSVKIKINPLSDYDIKETLDRNGTQIGTVQDEGSSSSNGKEIFYQYPQTELSGNNDYATTMTTNEDSIQTDNTNTKDLKTTDNYIKSISGNKLPQSDLLQKYRETFLNIDEQVVNSLDNLFFMLW